MGVARVSGKFSDAERKSQTATSSCFFIEPSGHGRLHGRVREFTYGKGRRLEQAAQVMQRLRNSASIRGCGVDGLRPGQFALDFRFVGRVALPAVVGEQSYFVTAGKMAENVIGTDLAPGVDWEQLARFDPQNSQSLFQSLQ